MTTQSLPFSILFGLLLSLAIPIQVNTFIPFLVALSYRKNMTGAMWAALTFGLVFDLLYSSSHFGFHTFSYIIAVFILYSTRKWFFQDSTTTIPLLTFIYSITITCIQALLTYIILHQNIVSPEWIGIDLIMLSLIDASLAVLLFMLPQLICQRFRIHRKNAILKSLVPNHESYDGKF